MLWTYYRISVFSAGFPRGALPLSGLIVFSQAIIHHLAGTEPQRSPRASLNGRPGVFSSTWLNGEWRQTLSHRKRHCFVPSCYFSNCCIAIALKERCHSESRG